MDNKQIASIITIGDELLIGQVIDTNSAWMAKELNRIGIFLKRRVAVGDSWDDIWRALDEESKHASIVLITGGLGPTADDITKPLLCKYFGGKMVLNEKVLDHITHLFEYVLKRPMIERNRKQAEVPDSCKVLYNERGTAPGMMFEKDGILFFSLPGVPYEMEGLMEYHVLPLLKKKSKGKVLSRTLVTSGLGESFLAERVEPFETTLPSNIKLAYLPNFGMVRLRLTAIGKDETVLEEEINKYFEQLQMMVQDVLVVNDDLTMQAAVAQILSRRNETIATAESCTGGYIAHLLTTFPGASSYFLGGVVSYDNEVKRNVLEVPFSVLETEGAVSEPVVMQMAKKAKALMQTDYAVAVSGIMGPDGGTPEKPVGTVWIAITNGVETEARLLHLRYNREKNIQVTANNALLLMYKFIQREELKSQK